MKIIAILDTVISVGGGFNQALNAIQQMQKLCGTKYDFEVISFHSQNEIYLKKLGLESYVQNYTLVDKFLSYFSQNAWWQSIQVKFKIIGPFEKKLLKLKCDLVYFVTPGAAPASLQKINYITTIWDLAHRDTPEFPEVRNYNQFHSRERMYIKSLPSSYIIITDSEQTAKRASHRYGVDYDRFLPMPFTYSPYMDEGNSESKNQTLKKYQLEEGYFYYPAQFWPHKNHIRILEALLILRREKIIPKIIFTGKDYGNKKHIQNFINNFDLIDQIKFLGFIDSEDIRGLYEGATAIVMPTYFGPTNLPPLEAWASAVPLIYSSHLFEQVGDAAITVDPDDANQLAKAMLKCLDKGVREKLVKNGKKRLQYFNEQRSIAEAELLDRLSRFAARRQCWE